MILFSLGRFGNYSFAAPVNPLKAVMVDLTEPHADAAPGADSDNQTTSNIAGKTADDRHHAQVQGEGAGTPPAVPVKGPVEPQTVEPAVTVKETTDSITRTSEPAIAPRPAASRHIASATALPPPLRTAGEFMSSKSEKLSYLISLLECRLEAWNWRPRTITAKS